MKNWRGIVATLVGIIAGTTVFLVVTLLFDLDINKMDALSNSVFGLIWIATMWKIGDWFYDWLIRRWP